MGPGDVGLVAVEWGGVGWVGARLGAVGWGGVVKVCGVSCLERPCGCRGRHLLACGMSKHKAEVNVEVVAFVVEHQIAVVSVSKHQYPHDNGVGGERSAEVVLRWEGMGEFGLSWVGWRELGRVCCVALGGVKWSELGVAWLGVAWCGLVWRGAGRGGAWCGTA